MVRDGDSREGTPKGHAKSMPRKKGSETEKATPHSA